MWYDLFSLFYDRALEDLYAPFRPAAIEALRLTGGETVLDLPCGTGQSFDGLAPAVGASGTILGVDASSGMLKKAVRRSDQNGWTQIRTRQADASSIDLAWLQKEFEASEVDRVLCAIGLTALPEWEATFERLFGLLRAGGRFVLFDVYAAERTRETKSVEWVARADLSREAWRPLEALCADFERTVLPADVKTFGGELYVAAGTKA
ncbi:MAG: methyltransferase domain-containing protein [Bacteroidota bacterium]